MLLLSACSSGDVFGAVEKHKDEVKDYEVSIDLSVVITNDETDEVLQSSEALMNSQLIEASANSKGTIKSINDDVKEEIEYYNIDDVAYANPNGEGWQKLDPEDLGTDDDSTHYKAIAKLVADIEDDVKVETKGDQYILTFQGKSEDVYKAFEKPYSVTLTGLTPDEVDQDIEITINKSTSLVEHVKNTITGTSEGLKLTLSIDHRYDKINEIKEIEVPEDVLDQAK